MRKIIFLTAILFSFSAVAQTVRLDNNGKSDAASQVEIRKALQTKDGGAKTELWMLAKVSDRFDARKLKAQGITVGSKAGDIITLRLTADKIRVLDQNADILQYCIAHPVYPTMNQTRKDTRTDSVQAGAGLPKPYTGKGVLIGITDWGFDYTHINYNNNGSNNRRLLRAWDQFKLSGPAPTGFDYGTVFVNRDELLEAQCDTFGLYGYATHGTHVAGISAGRGVDGNYTGQAPNANLLFASFKLNPASWLDAVAWMKDVAKEEGKRLVINNSWGMYTLGPIDGTSLASQAINNLSDSGIVFVTSAGNCGDEYFHLSRTFVSGVADTLRSVAKYYEYTEIIGQGLIIWGEPGKSFKASFAMLGNNDSVCFRWVNTADGSFLLDSALISGNDTLPFDIIVEQANPFNNRPHIQINVAKNANYSIHLAITADEGTVHTWNMTNLANGAGNMGAEYWGSYYPNYTQGDNEYGIGEPACAENCIAVAAHGADRVLFDRVDLGMLCGFSSHGPTMDGRQKPDLSAPGGSVVSSLNSFTTEVYSTVASYTYRGRNYTWARMSGTSMSCPAVTGIVALMLEANPDLTPYQIREILTSTARNDSITGPLHDRDSASNLWGWGKADALNAVNEALARVDIRNADENWFAKSLQIYPNPAADYLTVLTGRHTPEMVEVYSIDGRKVMSQEVVMEARLDVSRLAHGIYIVKCGARTARLVH